MTTPANAIDTAANRAPELPEPPDDEGYPPPCTSPEGVHDWPDVDEHERCLCTWCGADGDA